MRTQTTRIRVAVCAHKPLVSESPYARTNHSYPSRRMRAQTTRIRVAVLACTHKPPASKSPHAHTNRTRVAVSRFSAQEPNARRPPATRAARPSPCTIARPIRVTIQVTTLGQRPLACAPCSSTWPPSPVGAARRRRACVRT